MSSTRTTSADPLLIDTNVLLEATDEQRPGHAEATGLLETAGAFVFPAQVIREYLVVATRPVAANGLGMPVVDALENVREFRRRIGLLPEEKPVLATFLRVLADVKPIGKRIHDAHLVATALVHGVSTVVSFNVDDLEGLSPRVTVLSPGQVLRPPRRKRLDRPRRPPGP